MLRTLPPSKYQARECADRIDPPTAEIPRKQGAAWLGHTFFPPSVSPSRLSVTQSFNTATSMGRLTLNVLLSFAQFEREVTAERIRDKIAASKKGLWMGGYVPLGYNAPVEHAVKGGQSSFGVEGNLGPTVKPMRYTKTKDEPPYYQGLVPVLNDVPHDARIMSEEPFGPVASIQSFQGFDDVIARANALPYGLASFVFTRNGATARDAEAALNAGMVGVNHTMISTPETPFGGVNESGWGSESGIEGLEAFQRVKFVSELFA